MKLWELCDLETPWCLHVVVTLQVAEQIRAGETVIARLAAACGADSDALQRVLRHLATKGVFVEVAPGCFELGDLGAGLLEAGTRLGMDLDGFGGRMAHSWGTLLSAVRSGKSSYREAFGLGFWEDLEVNPEIGAQFDSLMGIAGHGVPDVSGLLDVVDWSGVRSVVDVGGGTGALLVEVLRARPELTGVLVDLPRVVAGVGELERVRVLGQSFFETLPEGGDLYLLQKVLCDWPDGEVVRILKRCADAAGSRGRVAVFNSTAAGEVPSPVLLMLVLVGGKDRSLDELCVLAGEAGLCVDAVGRGVVVLRVAAGSNIG